MSGPDRPSDRDAAARQVIYWRLLAGVFDLEDDARNLRKVTGQVARAEGLPDLVMDNEVGVDTLIQRFPELGPEVDALVPEEGQEVALRRDVLFTKILLNVFGPKTQAPVISASVYQQWLNDVGHLERACGFAPGTLRGRASLGGAGGQGRPGPGEAGACGGGGQGAGGPGGHGTGAGHLVSEEELREGLRSMEADLVKRMALREVLKDTRLANKLTPSMALVEQLLRDKSNLSGTALDNAKSLIRRYVNELAEVLKLQVEKAPRGKIDYDVPPKRVFRNLDLKRTLWQNLPNYNPADGLLYVDKLYFHHTARKTTPTRLIVVVDQSGSMVDAMVQCTILASIFSQLPNVDAHLMAFDTRVLDLTPWVSDPFEVLLRTQLGGGTYIRLALEEARQKIIEPRNTALVLISDFYEGGSDQELLNTIEEIIASGCHFIPVGAVTSGGYYSVSSWFRTRLKAMGHPILSGNIKKLIVELKQLL